MSAPTLKVQTYYNRIRAGVQGWGEASRQLGSLQSETRGSENRTSENRNSESRTSENRSSESCSSESRDSVSPC